MADDIDRRRRVAERLAGLGDRGDLDIGELLDREIAQLLDRLRARRARRQESDAENHSQESAAPPRATPISARASRLVRAGQLPPPPRVSPHHYARADRLLPPPVARDRDPASAAAAATNSIETVRIAPARSIPPIGVGRAAERRRLRRHPNTATTRRSSPRGQAAASAERATPPSPPSPSRGRGKRGSVRVSVSSPPP